MIVQQNSIFAQLSGEETLAYIDMDMVIAGLEKLPFWPQIVALGAAQGLSPELVAAIVIGVITTLISILMLPKTPPPLVALVSEAVLKF